MAKRKRGRQTNLRANQRIKTDGHYYHARVIKEVKYQKGEWKYLVEWAGYSSPAEDTWEVFACLKGCPRLLTSLWSIIGSDRRPRSSTIRLPEEWIESERRYFDETFGQDALSERCIPMDPTGSKKNHYLDRRAPMKESELD